MIFEMYMIFLEINTFFDESTAPKFIKRIMCRSRMYRLLKSIRKTKTLESYTWSDIYTLLNFVEAKEDNKDQDYFVFNITDDDNGDIDQLEVSFNPKSESMDITFTIKYDGNSIRSMLIGKKDTALPQYPTDMTKQALDDLNDIIRVYIDRFADSLHERSERIYKS